MEKMKMMLVDDEERFLSTTKKLLERKGFEVQTASSGKEALDFLQTHPVHVVILDVKMPGMDGVATLRAIKRQHPMVEVIMLTGHATMESAIDGLNSGAIDYLMKPANLEEIIEKTIGAYNHRMEIEGKIQVARMHGSMAPPSEMTKPA